MENSMLWFLLSYEGDCPLGYMSYLKGSCYKIVNLKLSFDLARDYCKSDLAGNVFWTSRLAEPRTAEAVDAAWPLVKGILMEFFFVFVLPQ